MQALQRIAQQIAQQLTHLSVNTKLLIGSIVVILLMGLLLVSQYAGRTNMSPLGLPGTTEVRAAAVSYLKTSNIPYEDRGDDIYVPVGQQYHVLGQLSEREIVASEEIDFNKLIDLQSNPFIGRHQAERMWLVAKMNGLSQMIAARRDVGGASVIIDPGNDGLGRAKVPATASVMVRMKNGPMSPETADAIGRMVAGTQANLKVENVTVTDIVHNRTFTPRSGDSLASGDYLELKQKTAELYREMILEQFRHIPGVVVTVNPVVKNTVEQRNERDVKEPVTAPTESETRDFTSSGGPAASEPGVRPNTAASISGGGSARQVSESSSKERLQPYVGTSDRVIRDNTGYPVQVNAMVRVPRSFFVKLLREEQGDPEAAPDPAQLDAIVARETSKWEAELTGLISTTGHADALPGTVVVSMFHDFNAPLIEGVSNETIASAPGGMGDLLIGGGLVKNVALGGLAVLSLVMMFLVVRRANTRDPLPSARELVGLPPALDAVESEIVGEADEDEPALDGVELDDGTMRTQQLLDQINDMVQNGPSEAANLMQHWISTDE